VLAWSGEARVCRLASSLHCVHLAVELCTTRVSLCGPKLDSLLLAMCNIMALTPTNCGRCPRCSPVGFAGVLYISNPNILLHYRPIPCVWGVCERKIRVSPISPLPRPGSSLVVQTRHDSRRKARRASLNTWQARRAFKSLGRSVLMVMSKVVGGPAPATRLIPTFLTAKHAQHQVFLTSLTCMDPQDTG
jgi:hypothetical protein